MKKKLKGMAAAVLWLAGFTPAMAVEQPTLWNSKEIKWTDLAEPAGARQAPLWSDPSTGDSGTLVRWKFNTKVADVVRAQNLQIVVLVGTFTVEIDGGYKEFGPGGFVSIPKGVKHTLGCEAAGECRFLLHLSNAGSAK